MVEHLTEEEQVEQLKQWWKENGLSIVGGVVIGLAAVFGWRAWQHHEVERSAQAGGLYDQLLMAAEARQTDAALQRHDQIRAQYGGTGYAALAGLHAAKLKLEAGDARAARELLETVRREATDPAIQEVATLRLARLYLDAGELDAARRLVDGMPKGAFGSQLAELRGDLARAGGDVAAARAAYEEALAGRHTGSNLLRFKLQDVAAPNG
jgi:predicted negative regulator of RcsB-dependent stress response